MSETPQVKVDCPDCGQNVVDIDLHQWMGEHQMSAEQVTENIRTLVGAHESTCKPVRAPVSARNQRGRRAWWIAAVVVPGVWAVNGVVMALLGNWAAVIASLSCAFLVALKTKESLHIYRSGYFRGRYETIAGVRTTAINLHPADYPDPPARAQRPDVE